MDTRRMLELAAVAGLGLALAALVLWLPGRLASESAATSGAVSAATMDVAPGELGEPMTVELPETINQGECPGVSGVVRFMDGHGWENTRFPRGTARQWRVADNEASIPGVNDEIMWGRVTCEASVGEASAWAVGGGSIGSTLSCEDKDYPTELATCRASQPCRVRTGLNYTFDASDVPHGIRITFDYKSKLGPTARFFVGVGNLDEPNEDGSIPLTGYSTENETLEADTGGEWKRGEILMFREAANIENLLIAFVYQDGSLDTPAEGGGYGVFIDNIHGDALFVENPQPCPSPPTPIPTPTDTPVPTETSVVIVPTKTPTPAPTVDADIFMPVSMREYELPGVPTSIPTVPPPTVTPTVPPTLTPTMAPPTATYTPRPTRTPRPTPTSTRTPIPVPDVIIDNVYYVSPGAENVQTVILVNVGTGPQDMTGWRVFGRQKQPPRFCDLEDGLVIEPGEEYFVYSGRDAEEKAAENPETSFACDDSYMFNQQNDEATLQDNFRNIISRFCWASGIGPYECPVLLR